MKRLSLLLAALFLSGCSTVELPGTARYFSNQPNGAPFFRVTTGVGGSALSVIKPDGKWTKGHPMKPIGISEPPLSTVPGLAELVKSAYSVDDYAFLHFRSDATVGGRPVPSLYFLYPGGFAYPVSSSFTRQSPAP